MSTATLSREQYVRTNELNEVPNNVWGSRTFQETALGLNPELQYRKTQILLEEYAKLMMNQHQLDVSYEVSESNQETILSWVSKDSRKLQSLCAFYDEDEFGIQLSIIQDGRRAGEKLFSSFAEFEMNKL